MFDPQNIQWKYVPREDNDLYELFHRMTDGFKRQKIETEKDWKILEGIVNLFFSRFRSEANEFVESIRQIKQIKEKGLSKDKEIFHVASLPIRLQKIIRICFPMQHFDKKFIYGMIKRLPLFKVGEI